MKSNTNNFKDRADDETNNIVDNIRHGEKNVRHTYNSEIHYENGQSDTKDMSTITPLSSSNNQGKKYITFLFFLKNKFSAHPIHRKLTLDVGGFANLYEGTSVKVKCPAGKDVARENIYWTKDDEKIINNG